MSWVHENEWVHDVRRSCVYIHIGYRVYGFQWRSCIQFYDLPSPQKRLGSIIFLGILEIGNGHIVR